MNLHKFTGTYLDEKGKPKVITKKKSLLQKPDNDVYGTNMTPTAEYVLAMRDIFNSGKET